MKTLYEAFHDVSPLGFSYAWHTNSGGHHPMHWHQELEILYPLNGEADIVIEGVRHKLLRRHILIVEENQIHSVHVAHKAAMYLCIHVSKERLRAYFPQIETRTIDTIPEEAGDEKFEPYLDLCRMLDDLTRRYMVAGETFPMEADGIILQVIAGLLQDFSREAVPNSSSLDLTSADRIRKVIGYVEEHYASPISLSDGAELLGLGREYFARFFKKMMGLTFLQYVSEVRLSHVYYDLMHTDLPVQEIMETNGFTNQKLFNSLFKQYYGSTPTQARKSPKQEQMTGPLGFAVIDGAAGTAEKGTP